MPQQTPKTVPPKRSAMVIALDVLLISILAVWALIGLICYGVSTCREDGCGDAILVVVYPALLVALLSGAYLVCDLICFISRLKHHQRIVKRHLVGAAIGLVPLVVFIWVLIVPNIQQDIQTNNALAQYQKDGGPTATEKASVTLSTLNDAKQLIAQCYVGDIQYARYDDTGPYETKNLYIIVITNNHYGDYDYTPPSIYLPMSDWANLVAAVNAKNANLTGPYPSCANAITVWSLPINATTPGYANRT